MDVNDEMRQAVAKEVSQAVAKEVSEAVARKVAKGVALFTGFLVFIVVGGFVVRLLWNWLLPSLFGVREITVWQALGLLALCRILFGGFGHGGGSQHGPRRTRHEWWRKSNSSRPASPPVENGPQS
jgi:hypothetical protein